MQVFTLGIFALQRSLKDIGAGGSLAFRDVNRSSCKHGCHVQILLEAGIGTGLAGHAVAPLDEHMALRRGGRDSQRLGCICDAVCQAGLAALVPTAQGAAAALFHLITGLKLDAGSLRAADAFAHAGRSGFFRAGGLHRRAGVGYIFQRTGGNIIGVRAAILGLVGVGAQIAQRSLETSALEVDITIRVVIRLAVAIFSFENLSRIQKFDPQLFTHVEQRHVKIIDLGLIHVGVIGVILRDRRHRVHDDIGVGVSLLNGLHQRGIIADKISHLHAGVVGAKGHHDTAGLHFCHRLCDGVVGGVILKGDDSFVQGHLGANALLGAELLQGDQTVVIQTHGVGVSQKQGAVQIFRARIRCFSQQSTGGVIDLIVIGKICAFTVPGGVRRHGVCGCAGRFRLSPFEQGQGDAYGQQSRQCADHTDQNGLPLQRCHRLFVRLILMIHVIFTTYPIVQPFARQARSLSVSSSQLSASSTGPKGSSSSLLP